MEKLIRSKKLMLAIVAVMLFSFLFSIVGITLPISRRSEKIEAAGSQNMIGADAIAIAMSHYSITTIKILQKYPGESAAYRSLCSLLNEMRQHYGIQDVYALYQKEGRFYYLLDARFSGEGGSYHAIGSDFAGEDYGKELVALLDEIYAGHSTGAFTRKALHGENGDYIVAAAPVFDEGGQVAAVLCVDITLEGIDFHKLWFIDFRYVAAIGGAVFVLSAAALIWWGRQSKKLRQKEKGTTDLLSPRWDE